MRTCRRRPASSGPFLASPPDVRAVLDHLDDKAWVPPIAGPSGFRLQGRSGRHNQRPPSADLLTLPRACDTRCPPLPCEVAPGGWQSGGGGEGLDWWLHLTSGGAGCTAGPSSPTAASSMNA